MKKYLVFYMLLLILVSCENEKNPTTINRFNKTIDFYPFDLNKIWVYKYTQYSGHTYFGFIHKDLIIEKQISNINKGIIESKILIKGKITDGVYVEGPGDENIFDGEITQVDTIMYIQETYDEDFNILTFFNTGFPWDEMENLIINKYKVSIKIAKFVNREHDYSKIKLKDYTKNTSFPDSENESKYYGTKCYYYEFFDNYIYFANKIGIVEIFYGHYGGESAYHERYRLIDIRESMPLIQGIE